MNKLNYKNIFSKELKSAYIGACCTVTIKGKFCPDEEVPTCMKMDETACACTTPECCIETGGEWKSASSNSICASHKSNAQCGLRTCVACKTTEILRCGAICSCGQGLKPVCSDNYSCTCEDIKYPPGRIDRG